MTTETTNYLREAADDAADTVRNFADEILEQLLDDGKASDDLLNDYPNGDAWHHESHVDKWYSMIDAATLIDQLDEFEETDSGLWEGQSFKEAIGTCAAFTYGNAVMSEWHDLIERSMRRPKASLTNTTARLPTWRPKSTIWKPLPTPPIRKRGKSNATKSSGSAATWNPYKPRRRPPWKS